jgi:hypothetical protein
MKPCFRKHVGIIILIIVGHVEPSADFDISSVAGLTSFCPLKSGLLVGNKCFFIHPESANWTSCWAKCREHQGRLASFHDPAEYDAVSAIGAESTG